MKESIPFLCITDGKEQQGNFQMPTTLEKIRKHESDDRFKCWNFKIQKESKETKTVLNKKKTEILARFRKFIVLERDIDCLINPISTTQLNILEDLEKYFQIPKEVRAWVKQMKWEDKKGKELRDIHRKYLKMRSK